MGNLVATIFTFTSTEVSTRFKVMLATQSRGYYRGLNYNIIQKKKRDFLDPIRPKYCEGVQVTTDLLCYQSTSTHILSRLKLTL